jgi:hypothetical protein
MDSVKITKLRPVMDYLEHEGIDYFKVIVSKLHRTSCIDVMKFLFLSLFYMPALKLESTKSENQKDKVLISRNFIASKRSDYSEIFENVSEFLDCDRLTISRNFNILQVINFTINFVSCFSIANHPILNLRDKLEVTFLFIYFRNFGKKINAIGVIDSYSKYISFCDSYLEENYLAQYANLKGLTTFTLQHGLYKNTGAICNNDSESYMNFVSNYMLLWGESTRRELLSAGIDEKRLKIVGMPKFNRIRVNNKTADYNEVPACVFFNGNDGLEDSFEMLDELLPFFEKEKILFKIKTHPTSKIKESDITKSNFFSGFSDLNDKPFYYNYVHNSGVAAELIMSNLPVLFYINNNSSKLYANFNSIFSCTEELSCLTRNYISLQEECKIQKEMLSVSGNKEIIRKFYINAIKE